jgi:predicted GNAT family N-acyltransferase
MITPIHKLKINHVQWSEFEESLRTIRTKVFIEEQQVPIDLEWDSQDTSAQHLLVLTSTNEPIACARLLNNGSIGRMAVLKEWRGLGLGAKLLNKAIAFHRQQGISFITLSAQVHAIPFYQKAGFEVISTPYLDAGILHVDMHLMPEKTSMTD